MAQLARYANNEDQDGVEALRDACYERWGMQVQRRDFLKWIVSEYEGAIVAAVGYDDSIRGQWMILDYYATDTKFGKRGVSAVLKLLLSEADEKGRTILGCSALETFIAHALKRQFRFIGVMLMREPRRQGCPV